MYLLYILFIDYLSTVSAAQFITCPTTSLLVNNELEGIWKEAAMV
jgi:hypothetical protein